MSEADDDIRPVDHAEPFKHFEPFTALHRGPLTVECACMDANTANLLDPPSSHIRSATVLACIYSLC